MRARNVYSNVSPWFGEPPEWIGASVMFVCCTALSR